MSRRATTSYPGISSFIHRRIVRQMIDPIPISMSIVNSYFVPVQQNYPGTNGLDQDSLTMDSVILDLELPEDTEFSRFISYISTLMGQRRTIACKHDRPIYQSDVIIFPQRRGSQVRWRRCRNELQIAGSMDHPQCLSVAGNPAWPLSPSPGSDHAADVPLLSYSAYFLGPRIGNDMKARIVSS